MNDSNSLGAVRDSLTAAKGALTDTHMHTPLDAIVRRGRACRARRRAAAGMAALACLVVAGLVAGSFAAATSGRPAVAGSSIRHTTWRLVSEVSAAGSSWRALSPSGYEQTFLAGVPEREHLLRRGGRRATGVHPRRRRHLATGGRHRDGDVADAGAADLMPGRPGLQRPG